MFIYIRILGHDKIAELLIKNEADVNANTDSGWTPLHEAANRGCNLPIILNSLMNFDVLLIPILGSDQIAELLIKTGADAGAKDKNGAIPICEAERHGKCFTIEQYFQMVNRHYIYFRL